MKPVLLELDETAARLILAALSVVHAEGTWGPGVGGEVARALDARADALQALIRDRYPALAVEYSHLYPGMP
jgi:hypothetical protein